MALGCADARLRHWAVSSRITTGAAITRQQQIPLTSMPQSLRTKLAAVAGLWLAIRVPVSWLAWRRDIDQINLPALFGYTWSCGISKLVGKDVQRVVVAALWRTPWRTDYQGYRLVGVKPAQEQLAEMPTNNARHHCSIDPSLNRDQLE